MNTTLIHMLPTRRAMLVLVGMLLLSVYSSAALAEDNVDSEEYPWKVDQELPIDIVGGNGASRVLDPVAIPRAKTLNAAAERHARIGQDIVDILRFDMTISGLYRVMDESSFFFDTSQEGLDTETINFKNWSGVGAIGLIKAAYKVTEDKANPKDPKVQLDIRYFIVRREQQVEVKWKSREVRASKLRDSIHDFVNAVCEVHLGAWGPFGTSLALTARSSGQKHIYVMDMDGANISRITRNSSINILPSWGPKGGVYFTSYQDGNPNLYLASQGKQRIISAKPGQNTGASFCRDKVALTLSIGGTNTDIYVINPNSGAIVTRLTEHWAIDTSPTFSPDCKKIAFVSDRAGGPQLYVTNSDGSSKPRRLTHAGGYNTTPDWSPKGDKIVFTGRGGRHDIFTVDMEGYIQRLTTGQGSNENPSWSPDGNFIAFTSTRGGGGPKVYIMTADGFTQTRITSRGGYEAPAWRR